MRDKIAEILGTTQNTLGQELRLRLADRILSLPVEYAVECEQCSDGIVEGPEGGFYRCPDCNGKGERRGRLMTEEPEERPVTLEEGLSILLQLVDVASHMNEDGGKERVSDCRP